MFVMSQRQDSILEPLHVKAANPFSDVHVTIKALFKNAKITIDVLSTRKTVLPAKPVDCENVSWLECPSQVIEFALRTFQNHSNTFELYF